MIRKDLAAAVAAVTIGLLLAWAAPSQAQGLIAPSAREVALTLATARPDFTPLAIRLSGYETEANQGTIVNPVWVEFESLDHALAVRYELAYFLAGASEPHLIVPLPVAQVTGGPTYSALLSKPLLGINLTLKARLVATAAGGGEIMSPWSNSTDPFDFSPLAPVVRVRK